MQGSLQNWDILSHLHTATRSKIEKMASCQEISITMHVCMLRKVCGAENEFVSSLSWFDKGILHSQRDCFFGEILRKPGWSEKMINILWCLHDAMKVSVNVGDKLSEPTEMKNRAMHEDIAVYLPFTLPWCFTRHSKSVLMGYAITLLAKYLISGECQPRSINLI